MWFIQMTAVSLSIFNQTCPSAQSGQEAYMDKRTAKNPKQSSAHLIQQQSTSVEILFITPSHPVSLVTDAIMMDEWLLVGLSWIRNLSMFNANHLWSLKTRWQIHQNHLKTISKLCYSSFQNIWNHWMYMYLTTHVEATRLQPVPAPKLRKFFFPGDNDKCIIWRLQHEIRKISLDHLSKNRFSGMRSKPKQSKHDGLRDSLLMEAYESRRFLKNRQRNCFLNSVKQTSTPQYILKRREANLEKNKSNTCFFR